MPSEWAIQEARKLALGTATEAIANSLDSARAQGRREGLEEAAMIVEDTPLIGKLADGDTFWRGPTNFADDIRARIAQEPTA